MNLPPDLHDQKEWTATGEWRKGPTITMDDLINGTGLVERVTSEEWLKTSAGTAGAAHAGARPVPRKEWTPPKGKTMGFGKYKDRLMADIREEDPRYFRWCVENVGGFKEKAGELADDA